MLQSLVLMSLAMTSEAVKCLNIGGQEVTCKEDGTAMQDKGKDCIHMLTAAGPATMCDADVASGKTLCEAYGSPTTCCEVKGAGKFICSGGKGFTKKATEDDFKDCSATCNVGGGGSKGESSMSTIGASLSSSVLLGVSAVLGLH